MFAEYKPKIVTSEIHVVYNVCDNTNQPKQVRVFVAQHNVF